MHIIRYVGLYGTESFLAKRSPGIQEIAFIEPEGTLLYSQESFGCPSSKASGYPLIQFLRINCSIILPATLTSCKLSLCFGFPTKTLQAQFAVPLPATYPTHLILSDFIV